MIPIVCIEGATAVGKSAIAMKLAKTLNSEIISADSRQVYRHLNIGTAKPDANEQAEVTHHLINIIDPDQAYNAGNFCNAADAIITELWERQKTPIICGGTGLYVRSLLQGLFICPPVLDDVRKQIVEQLNLYGAAEMYKRLQSVDFDFASKISSNDIQRITRGLEVYESTGVPMSVHWSMQKKNNKYLALRILVEDDRAALYNRIDNRVSIMIEHGLLSEIEGILSLGYSWDSRGMQTMGYKEFMPYFEGEMGLEHCIELTRQHSRNYAKRQLTWYRKCDFDLTINPQALNISHVEDIIKAHSKLF